ncbi:hypothetical protein HDV00_006738 [Rhizophlyctis rosea]|nr:hypothetical protein HDV00_006738 [Rhizophlyctis rosea]
MAAAPASAAASDIVGGYGRRAADVEGGAGGVKPTTAAAETAKPAGYAPNAATAPVPVAGGSNYAARELPAEGAGAAGTVGGPAPVSDVPATTSAAAAPLIDKPELGNIHKFNNFDVPGTRTALESGAGGGPSAGKVAAGLAAGAAAGAVAAGAANRKEDDHSEAPGGPAPIGPGYDSTQPSAGGPAPTDNAPNAPTTADSAPSDTGYSAVPLAAAAGAAAASSTTSSALSEDTAVRAPQTSGAPAPATETVDVPASGAPSGPTGPSYSSDTVPTGSVPETTSIPTGNQYLAQPEGASDSHIPYGAIAGGAAAGAAGAALLARNKDEKEDTEDTLSAPGGPEGDVTGSETVESADVPTGGPAVGGYNTAPTHETAVPVSGPADSSYAAPAPADTETTDIAPLPVPAPTETSYASPAPVDQTVGPAPGPVASSDAAHSEESFEGSVPEQPAREAPAAPTGGYSDVAPTGDYGTKLEDVGGPEGDDSWKTALGVGAGAAAGGLLAKKALDRDDDKKEKPTSKVDTIRKSQDSVAPRDSGFHPSKEEIAAGAVFISGLGFVTYEQWLKHHNKTASPETRQEFEKSVRPLSGEYSAPTSSTTSSDVPAAPSDIVVPSSDVVGDVNNSTYGQGPEDVAAPTTTTRLEGLDTPSTNFGDLSETDVNKFPAGKIAGAALVGGLGYLTYEQWIKHHNKQDTPEARQEFITQRVTDSNTTSSTTPVSQVPTTTSTDIRGPDFNTPTSSTLRYNINTDNSNLGQGSEGIATPGAKLEGLDTTTTTTSVSDLPETDVHSFPADKIAGGVLIGGLGYLTYEQWRKHHNKSDTPETRKDFLSQRVVTDTNTTISRPGPQYTKTYTVTGAVNEPGVGYLTFVEWVKHHNKKVTDSSVQEFQGVVQPGYEQTPEYTSKFGNKIVTVKVTVTSNTPPSNDITSVEGGAYPIPTPTTTTRTVKRYVDQNGNEIQIPKAVLVGGVGYLTYQEWLKHHNKPANADTQREFDSLVTPGYERDETYLQRIIRSLRKTTFVVKDQNGNVINVPEAVNVPGVGFLTYEEWVKHLNKPDNEESRNEFGSLVTPEYKSDRDYIMRFVNSRSSSPPSTTIANLEPYTLPSTKTTTTGDKESVSLPQAVLVPTVGYLTFTEWLHHHNKPDNEDSRREFQQLVKPGYERDEDFLVKHLKSTGHLPPAVLIPGIGYLTYIEWLNHTGKSETPESKQEFDSLVTDGYENAPEYRSKFIVRSVDENEQPTFSIRRIVNVIKKAFVPGVGYLTYEEWVKHSNREDDESARRDFAGLAQSVAPETDADGPEGAVLVPEVGYLMFHDWLEHTHKTDTPETRQEFLGLVQPGWEQHPEVLERYGTVEDLDEVEGATYIDGVGWLVYEDWLEHEDRMDSPINREIFATRVVNGWDTNPEFVTKYGKNYRFRRILKEVDGAALVDGVWYRYEDWLGHFNRTHSDETRREFESQVPAGWEENPDFIAKYGQHPKHHSMIIDDISGATYIDGAGWLTYWDWLEYTKKPHTEETIRKFRSLVKEGYETDPEYIGKYGQYVEPAANDDAAATVDTEAGQARKGWFTRVVEGAVGVATTAEKAVEGAGAALLAAATGSGKKDTESTETTEQPTTESEPVVTPAPASTSTPVTTETRSSTARSRLPITRVQDPVILTGGASRSPRHQDQIRRSGATWNHQVPSFDSIEEDDVPDLSAYHPPAPTSHVVVTAYTPIRPDEMPMQVGDLVGIEREFGDGWARGQNITHGRRRGLFPITILTPIRSGPSQTVAKVGGKHWLGWQERKAAAAEQGSIRGIPARNVSLMRRRSQRSIRSNKSGGSGGDRRSISSINSQDGTTSNTLPRITEEQPTPTPTPAPAPPAASNGSSTITTNTTIVPPSAPASTSTATSSAQQAGVLSEKSETHTNEDGSNVEVKTTVTREPDGRVITKVVTITTTRHADGRVTRKTNTRTTTSNIPVPAK